MANPRTIAYPFGVDPQGRIAFTTDPRQQIADEVRAVLSTHWYERVMLPRFGLDLQSYLYGSNDPTTVQMMVQQEVQTAFNTWLPGLSLQSVVVDNSAGVTTMTITVSYIVGSATQDNTVQEAVIEIGGTVVPTYV